MENENLKPIEKLTPFTKMIMTIGTLPSSFYASMSYYESMVWLYEYLKNEVIPTVNNNAEAVEELQQKFLELKQDEIDFKALINQTVEELETYMNNYFNNLDVQQEINNKLDEMAENGTLTLLIKNYVNPFINAQNLEISNFKSSINSQLTVINDKINTATSGSPKGVYATVAALETADPDHDYIYIVEDDGKWYYYNTSTTSWTAGGTYQSTQNTEVEGIREGYDGQTYETAGSAVRSQVTDIHVELNKALTKKFTYTEYTKTSEEVTLGHYYTTNTGNIVENENYQALSMLIENKSYFYLDASVVNRNITIYNSASFGTSSFVKRISDDFPTKDNPIVIDAGNYVVCGTNSNSATLVLNVSNYNNYEVNLNDIKMLKPYNALNFINYETHKFLNENGNPQTTSSSENPIVTDYIDAFYGQTFNWYCKLPKTLAPYIAICTYNENKEFLTRTTYSSVTSTDETYRYQLYNYLVNDATTKYIRVSYRTYNGEPEVYLNNELLTHYLNDRIVLNKYRLENELLNTSINKPPVYPFDNCYPISIAHRGYELTAPENTLPAFRLAKSKGFDFVECDLRFTSDNVCVLLHDETINRVARNSDGSELSDTINIEDITYTQALIYSFGYYKDAIYADVKICTLEELLILANEINLYLALDCGNGDVYDTDNFENVYKLIKKYKMLDKVVFIAPSIQYIEKFSTFYPKAYMVVNRSSSDSDLSIPPYGSSLKTPFNRVCINYNSSYINADSITNCLNHGLDIGYWLAQSEEEMDDISPFVNMVTSDIKPYNKYLYDKNIGNSDTGLLN